MNPIESYISQFAGMENEVLDLKNRNNVESGRVFLLDFLTLRKIRFCQRKWSKRQTKS